MSRERQLVRGIAYGGDYNPEQWPESTWAEDIRLMAEAGVNLVTVGVFSWSRLQPAPGELTAGWLDRVLDLLAGAGIGVDLATGTASPPPWLVAAHPEILPVTADGRRLAPGARQHYCPSAPAFRAAAVDLATRMARRYAGHPAVTMWHVGNEYGCHVPACYCELSARAFRGWLRARYGELGRLNEAWGGAVWSQDYTSWDQVEPPRTAPTFANPAQQLDFARFSSGELLACYRAERAALAGHSPGKPVTTNFMGLFRPVDQFRWAAELDVVSVDSYPDPADAEAHLFSAMACDLTRSVGGGRPWVLMEQAPNAVNWRAVNVPKAPGQYRALSLQAVARGGDAILSFQWRAAAAGAEKFHSGMLPHAGTDSRVWREVAGLGADLTRLAPVAGRPVPAEVAMLLDWESWWALELDSHPSRLRLVELLGEFYRPLFEAGVTADFAHPESDLSRYRLVLVPALYLVSDAGADNVGRFAASGGTVMISFFSGIVDPIRPDPAWRVPGAVARSARAAGGGVRAAARGCGGPARTASPGPTPRTASAACGRTPSTFAVRTRCCATPRVTSPAERPRPGTRTVAARRSTSARCRTGRPCAAWWSRPAVALASSSGPMFRPASRRSGAVTACS